MQAFKDKVVWITGASSGIGREAALQLNKMGAKLILSARREAELVELKSELDESIPVKVLPIDLINPESFSPAVSSVYDEFGRVDLLFNIAGISQRSYVLETDLTVDRKIMEINYFGTVALTKAILPRMVAAGEGQFGVVTSVTGKFGFGVRSAYAASKHALHGFFESLRLELAEKGIKVTLICPGPIQTDISKNALGGDGNPTGEMDEMQENGMPVGQAVSIMLKSIANEKKEIIIGGFKEKLGVKLHTLWPNLFFKMAAKQNPRGELKM